jgi:hypothetical protein
MVAVRAPAFERRGLGLVVDRCESGAPEIPMRAPSRNGLRPDSDPFRDGQLSVLPPSIGMKAGPIARDHLDLRM